MKKFLFNTLLAFALVFIFLFSMTMMLEKKNKGSLNTEVQVEFTVENGEIVVPETPGKVEANYEFTKLYFYTGVVLSTVLPLLFYVYNGIEVIKKKNFKSKVVEGGAVFILYSFFTMVVMFPKSFFSYFYRGRLVGLVNISFLDFLKDLLSSTVMDMIISLPIIVVIYVIFIKCKRWYIYTAVILIGVSLIGNYVYPYVDEWENDLEIMEEGELKEDILSLAREAGIEDLDIRVVKKSDETSSMNAYMTGLKDSRRIVFWDTTLEGLSEKEILQVAAHEIGHYKLKHIIKGTILNSLIILLSLVLLHNIMKRFLGGNYRTLKNIPYVLLLFNLIAILSTPIETTYSRKMEVEADTFAIEATKDGYTNGKLEFRFIESNLTPITVDTLYKNLACTHPTVKERIELSNKYIRENKE